MTVSLLGVVLMTMLLLAESSNHSHTDFKSSWLDSVQDLDVCMADLPFKLSGSLSVASPSFATRRRLAAVLNPPNSLFRSISGKGMRGFLEGGAYPYAIDAECAQRCVDDPLCLSFDLETSTKTCYISHTDRYAHPEAFLDFPTGIYNEWQGVVDAPELEPNGGRYSTQIAVRLLTRKIGATIHYIVVPSTSTRIVTGADLTGSSKSFSVAASGDVIILPHYSCRIFALAVKDGLQDSPMVASNEYKIYAPKYLFLVPYFNGEFHGRVARIQLDVRGKKRPRPARFHEFSDYETYLGIGPYPTQVSVIDMTTVDPNYKGFYGGFTAFARTAFVNETYLVPAQDDKNYMVATWRVVLESQYQPHPQHTGGAPTRLYRDAEYLYLAPFFNGATYLGQIIRVTSLTFDTDKPIIEQLNLTKIDPDLKGFASSFTDDENYAYFVPQKNDKGLFGKIVRLDHNNFSPAGVTVLDLAAINPRFVGFSSGFKYKNYAYLVPFLRPLRGDELTTNLREFPVTNSGMVVRVDLSSFSTADSLDLTAIHPRLAGFSGAVRVANFAYFVPYMTVKEPASIEVNPYSGLVARVDLRDFKTVQYVDLTEIDTDLRGFVRGFAYKQYVFLVPHRSQYYSPGRATQSGKVVRIDTNNFTPSGVSYLDLTVASRSQVPDMPDKALRGFSGGVVSGKYGFFVPYFNGATFSGKVCRINLDRFNEVQTLDLTQLDTRLRGFAGGILSKTEESLETDLFAEFEIRPGTTSPYEYVY